MNSKRISRMVVFTFAALALLALLTAACGGDDDSSSKTTSPGGTTVNGTPSGNSGSKTASADATGGGNATGSGVDDLKNAAKNFKNQNFKITYDATMTDSDGKVTTGTLVMAQKGSSSSFSATNLVEDGGSVTFINDGKDSYICTDTPEKTCLKTTSAAGGADPLGAFSPAEILSGLDGDGAKVDKVADQTIAGHSAKCYKATDTTGGGTICLDKKTSYILSVDGDETDGSKTKLTAKNISDSPSDNDFKPPYAVKSISGQ